jgi:uncharacterized protein (DUF1778 family)
MATALQANLLKTNATKTEVVNIRFEPHALETIRRAAKSTGLSVSAYLTMTALNKAKQDLLDEHYIVLSPEAFDAVQEQIERPAAAHAELTKLMRTKFEWINE